MRSGNRSASGLKLRRSVGLAPDRHTIADLTASASQTPCDRPAGGAPYTDAVPDTPDTGVLGFQVGGGLLGDHRPLHALEQGFGFGERQPEGLGPQCTPFELGHVFDTLGLPTDPTQR